MEPKKNPDKDIHRYSRLFFLIGLCTSITLVICAFEWTSQKPIVIVDPPPVENPVLYIDPPQTKLDPPKPVSPIQNRIVIPIIPEIIIEGEPDQPDTSSWIPEINPSPEWTPAPEPETTDTMTFRIVEKMPEPVGGYHAFYNILSKEIKYPAQARRFVIEGRVFVEFIVDRDGEVKNLSVIKGIGSGCDEEALRALSKIKWEPGKQRGKPVRVKMVMPVIFKLQ